MLSRTIMLSASVLAIGAFYYRRKEQFFKNLFKQLQNCQKYQMDYVEDVKHLPVNHGVLLYGPVSAADGAPVVSSSFIRKSAETDRLWNMKLRKGFRLMTADNQPVQVADSGDNQVLVFNLPLSGRELSKKQYEERAIMNNHRISVYGKLKSQSNKLTMLPELLIGNQQETLLTYLDKQILSFSTKSKILTGLATGLFFGHAFYYNIYRPKTEIEKEMEQFETTAKGKV